jgi:SAM-dependent methyltransferase
MTFYDDISAYYDSIFPMSKDTLEFLKNSIGESPKAILDVACGTGAYSIELDKMGYDLTASDIDKKMIETLRQKIKSAHSKLKFLQADMLNLHEKFEDGTFDAIYCIGNSIVHLESLDQIEKFILDAHKLLAHNGVLIFQIINFDRVISKDVKSLPTIVDEAASLKFERFYNYQKDIDKITFKTILSIKDKIIENEINLIPLMHDEAVSFLKEAGFKEIKAYGDFKKNDFDKENSYSLVIVARI